MAKFKKGDRVEVLSTDSMDCFNVGDIGIVDENNSTCPYVLFDGVEHAMYEHQAELIEDTKVNRLKGLKLKFDVTDNPELSEAIQKRLFELGGKWFFRGQELSFPTICGYNYIHIHDNGIMHRTTDSTPEYTVATLNDLYHLPKTHTITLEDGRQVELSEESYRQFEDVEK